MTYTSTSSKQKITYIKDSEIGNIVIPASICIFQNNNTYSMVEVCTRYRKGSDPLKIISKTYHNIKELMEDEAVKLSSYPLLHNCIIYNDKIMSAL